MQLHLDVWDDAYRGLMPQEILDERWAKLDERIERWSLSSRPSTSPMRTISRGIVRRSGRAPSNGPAAGPQALRGRGELDGHVLVGQRRLHPGDHQIDHDDDLRPVLGQTATVMARGDRGAADSGGRPRGDRAPSARAGLLETRTWQ